MVTQWCLAGNGKRGGKGWNRVDDAYEGRREGVNAVRSGRKGRRGEAYTARRRRWRKRCAHSRPPRRAVSLAGSRRCGSKRRAENQVIISDWDFMSPRSFNEFTMRFVSYDYPVS